MTTSVVNDVITVNEKRDNKADAIRRALQTQEDSTPTQIAEHLKHQGIDVTPAYVSVIKGQVMRKAFNNSFEALRLARKLIKETGNTEGAKRAIEAVGEEIERSNVLRTTYTEQLNEIEIHLGKNLDPKDRRELTNDRKRIQKLLAALEDL